MKRAAANICLNQENDRSLNDNDDRNSSLPKDEQHRKTVLVSGVFTSSGVVR